MTVQSDTRYLLLHKQPAIGDLVWVWRKDSCLFYSPMRVTLGEWDAIYWRDGESRHTPEMTDMWIPCEKPAFDEDPTP